MDAGLIQGSYTRLSTIRGGIYYLTNATGDVTISTEPSGCTGIVEGTHMGDDGNVGGWYRPRDLKAERRAALEALRKKQARRR